MKRGRFRKMNDTPMFFLYLLVMALVTYLIRMLPLVFCRKEIKNKYVKSFLYYIPYTVLTAMTFPSIFYSTGSTESAIIGTVVAVVLALFKRGLLTVAIGATLSVFAAELVISFI